MDLLKKLPMPNSMTHDEIVDLLLREEYGYLPPRPTRVSVDLDANGKPYTNFCAGLAEHHYATLHCEGAFGSFSFPFHYTKQRRATEPVPAIIHINFRSAVPDLYEPSEELVEAGYNVLSFGYKDVTTDDGDFTNGLAGVIYPDGKRELTDCGKIGLWAWAAMCLIDFACTLPEIDHSRISVAGHSRLGKTALLTGALDARVYCAYSNGSGCCGASLARETEGEDLRAICTRFPYWFSEHFLQYIDRENELPFDQHYLLAANAPHRVYVGSAEEDAWAYPKNEYLSCVAASSYFKEQGLTGFVHPDRLAETGDAFHEGTIGYHRRPLTHYFSRKDWSLFLQYLSKQK